MVLYIYLYIYVCFQDEGKIGHLLLLIFPMSALSQWPSFESFIYSGSLSKPTSQICFSMPLGVIKCFTFEKSQYVLWVCLLYWAPLLSSLFSPYKKQEKKNSHSSVLSAQRRTENLQCSYYAAPSFDWHSSNFRFNDCVVLSSLPLSSWTLTFIV